MADRTRVLNFKRGKPGKIVAKHGPFTIRCLAADEYELLVYGDIGDSWMGDSITAAAVVKELQTVEAKTIHVRINSYGGSVSDGLAIFNALRRHGADIQTHVDGIAYSIASLIAMAGDTVTIAENALLMIHAPWGALAGNAAQMREYADVLDIYAEAMVSAYTRKTGDGAKGRVEQLLKDGKDHYFTADEAVADGFADQTTAAIAVAASLRHNLSRFTNQPAAAAAFHHEADMNFRTLAAALGIKLARGSDDNAIKAKVLAHLNLKTDATDEQVQAALDERAANPLEPAAGSTADPPPDVATIRAQVRAEETARRTEIRQAFAGFRSREEIAALETICIDDANCTVEKARAKLLAKLGEGAEPLNGGLPGVSGGQDSRDKFVAAGSQALLARVGIGKVEGSNPLRGQRLIDMARASLERAGVNVRGKSNLEIAELVLSRARAAGSQGTSDFPVILENTMHKLVLTGFQAVTPIWSRICKVGDVSDFRAWNRLVPGLIGNLEDVNEHGEYKNKNLPDATKESIQVKRRGNIFAVTPEALVNDDLGQLRDMLTGIGMAGQRTIDRRLADLINLNSGTGPTMGDGVVLFHADHNNVGTPADPTVIAIDEARSIMAQQTAPGEDEEYLDIRPAVVLAHTVNEGTLKVLNSAEFDPDTANKLQRPNMVRGLFRDVVSTPRLDDDGRWYTLADPNVAPVFEVVFLDGQREPRIVQEENFRTSGLAWKVELPFGVGAIDFRGGVFNAGG